MDILEMLENNYDELCDEDFEMIKEELIIGNYPHSYVEQCRRYLKEAKVYAVDKKSKPAYKSQEDYSYGFYKDDSEIRVDTKTDKETANNSIIEVRKEKTNQEKLREELGRIHAMADSIKRFGEFVDICEYITNDFIDQNMNEFNEAERSVLLRKRKFSEEFLEKYFDVLDHGALALNQLYSEEFFMRHFDNMPTKLVLIKSQNTWRQKSRRSKKLSTFLRLKGVKI